MLFVAALMTLGTIGFTSCGGDEGNKEPDPVQVSSVTVSPNSIILIEGGISMTVKAEVSPANATDKSVTWSSSNESVATVSGGTITPKSAGSATITAKAGGKTATCDVTVKAATVSVTGVSLDKTTLELTEGESETLTAAVKPDNSTNKNVTWKSSNTAVATVENGKVTAVKAGTAKITVTTEDGSKTATCDVTVKAATVSVTEVSLDKTTLELTEGESETLTAAVKPDNATNKNVTWKSSNTAVATVENGRVTAVKAGTAKITVTTEDGGKTATCDVTVKASTLSVTGVSLDKTTLELTEGESETLIATVKPDNATNKNVTWKSSNTAVATVENGRVTAVKAGTAKITVTTEDGGKTATCDVTVKAATLSVTGVSLDKTTLELTEGESETLTAAVKPDNATNKNVTWKSSNDAVATVENGKVTAVKAGTAKITVTTEDGGKTATCDVTVKAALVAVSGVSLDETTLDLVEGDVATLIATVKPDNATNKSLSWKSSNDAVATVKNGKVTAVKAGTAKITVTTEDGGKMATCDVTVKAATASVTGVSLDKTTLELTEGGSETLTATVNPSNATNKNVTWKSSNTAVATVEGGKVTAVKAGTAKITVTTEDGGKTATCDVTVKAATASVTGVSLDKTTLELTEGESETLTAAVKPDNATNKNVTWKSSNDAVATVENGKVTAVKAGTAKISVTTEDGSKTATCDVTVKAATLSVTGVSLDKTTLELTEGESETLTAAVKPDNATNKSLSWKSSNDAVATVENGRVTAVKAGTAKITVTTEDGSKTATCDVTVKAATVSVTGVSLDKTTLELTERESETLTATVKPDNATNKNVKWSTSSSTIATVVDGKVTAVKAGTAKITVTTEDGGRTATCEVTVKGVAVTGITLNVADNISLAVGGTHYIRCTVSPDNAANKNVKWSSSDNSKVKINSQDNTEARIEAVAEGSSTITAMTEDGRHTAKCTVKVVAPADFAGSGTEDDPYRISTKKDLETLATKVNGGERYDGKYFKLMNNIDLGGSSSPWTPIGGRVRYFRGEFDGNSKTISGLYINQPTLEYQALFGYVKYAEIRNLTVTGSVTGGEFCGGIVAQADGLTITGCTSNVTVTGESRYVGGIVGRVVYNHTIKNCTNKGKITGTGVYVGGIAGCANGRSECLIADCSNSGNITGSGILGGIAGYGATNVFSCYNSGTISSDYKSGYYLGGIVGQAGCGEETTYIVSCYNAGAVTAPKCDGIGGVVGTNITYGVVSSCYNTASVSGARYVGGVVGKNVRQVIASYNRGAVSGNSGSVGGVIGYIVASANTNASMSYCLNAADGGTDVAVGQCAAGVTVGTDVKALSKTAMTNGTMLKDLNTAVDSYNSTKPTNVPTAIKFKAGTGGWPEF